MDYGSKPSWLLIKHRDDWAGDVDIAGFAPRSVKSDGDFEDILAQDNPAVWHTNRPAKGGDTGAMFATIIERAARLKAGRSAEPKATRSAAPKDTGVARTKDAKVSKDTKKAAPKNPSSTSKRTQVSRTKK
jgi:hypothetical protein